MSHGLNRRQFLGRTAAAAGAASVLGAPLYVPPCALGLDKDKVAPSNRIVFAGIGIGGRGQYDLDKFLKEKDVQAVAVCDVRKIRREAVKGMIDRHNGNTDCKTYRDINEFLAQRKDIDAVLIATGDRWHALAAILAMKAGKDVYSEKPSSMTIQEGRAVASTARKFRRVYQTGTQRLSESQFVVANELLKSGRLGRVHTVRAHIAPWDDAYMRRDHLPGEPEPPKEECDWDAWLGPCPQRPYNSAYVKGGWRGHYDFHTSCIGEWGAHTFAQCQFALGLADTSPVEYKFVENKTGDGMETTFASGQKMILQREGWRGSCGVRYEGTDGWVACADGYDVPDVSSPALLSDAAQLVKLYQERTGRPTGKANDMRHVRNFLDCIKSREQAVANADVMHHSMATVHAANICMWLKKDLRYDPVKEEFNDSQANTLRSRPIRKPWTL